MGKYGFEIPYPKWKVFNGVKGNLKSDFSIRGELIINEKIYEEKFKDKYTTARHLTNGMVNSKKFSKDVAKIY